MQEKHCPYPGTSVPFFKPGVCNDEDIMRQKAIELVELNKARKERDNISVILIRPVVEDK